MSYSSEKLSVAAGENHLAHYSHRIRRESMVHTDKHNIINI